MAKAKIFYLLSEAGRKDSIKKGGDGKAFQVIETDVTPEILELAKVTDDGQVLLAVGCAVDYKGERKAYDFAYPIQDYEMVQSSVFEEPRIKPVLKEVFFDTVQTSEQLIAHEKARLERIAKNKAEVEKAVQEAMLVYKANQAQRALEKAALEKEKAERKAAIEAEKAAFEKDRRDWILAHGSAYLRDCLEMGIKANLEYVVERAELEFPDFTVDYADNARWEEKFSPSPEALSELKELRKKDIDAEIVWLTSPAKERTDDDCYYEQGFDPCEAILIRNFLGRYCLVKKM
jgi:FMN phosphatase YigB (HAD superfamily)